MLPVCGPVAGASAGYEFILWSLIGRCPVGFAAAGSRARRIPDSGMLEPECGC
ncbi:predicted protein [Streptomyces sp. AA4]|nr:predicted protein [Streptomyces sp. AA4]